LSEKPEARSQESEGKTGGGPARTSSRYGPFHTDRCGEPPPELLRLGVEQLNRGEYFEQHETLETLWRAERDDVRYLYQGILLVGVGLFHLKRGNLRGAAAKLATGVRFLQWFAPACQGVDVAALIADADRARESILALGPEHLAAFDWSQAPRVRWVCYDGVVP
jgi:predicted metal-dependent hydrolase